MLVRLMGVAVSLCSLPLAAQSKASLPLEEALVQARTPLVITEGRLSGAGAEVLSQAVASSRFVLLGEDHFSREIPQLASALCDMIHPDAYAVEAGPEATEFVNTLLASPDRVARMSAFDKTYPDAIAFLDRREENDLAAHCAAASHNPHFQLWGLDQEYVGSAGALLAEMADSKPGPRSRAAIVIAKGKEREAESAARASGRVDRLSLLASSDNEVEPLRQAIVADGNFATRRVLGEFLASRAIYQLHLKSSSDGNKVRAELLKKHFLDRYVRLKAQTPEPHVFFKFGGMHTGKGFSFLHQRDLGNFVSELADGEQTQSLHIFVVGIRGVHSYPAGYGRPIVPQPFVMANDPDWAWMAPATSLTLPRVTGSSGITLTLFDLRQLRLHDIVFEKDWEHLVYSYDLLVLIPDFTAATLIP